MWTLQEYVIPASLSFWYGTRTVDRADVEDALIAADKCTALPFKETPAFYQAWNRRRVRLHELAKSRSPTSMSLAALAAYSSCFDATDDRDRLYGIWGIATDTRLLRVDYASSVEEVYLRFVKSFIEYHKSLDIICFASIYSALPGSSLPCWVPDWRRKLDPLVIPLMVSQSTRTHIGNFRPTSKISTAVSDPDDSLPCYAASKGIEAVYEFQGNKLVTQGTVLGIVDGLGGSMGAELVQSSSTLNCPQTMTTGHNLTADLATNILTKVCRSLAMDRKDRYLRIAMPVEDFFKDFMWLCAQSMRSVLTPAPETIAPKEFKDWFDATQSLLIHGLSLERILGDSQEIADIVAAGPGSKAPNQDEYIQETFFNRFFDTVVRLSLRLMVSDNGHIGLTTGKAEKGDLVCVLFGCSVPVLLRRKPNSEDDWSFVGECFLDGFMNGECCKQPDSVERAFCIE